MKMSNHLQAYRLIPVLPHNVRMCFYEVQEAGVFLNTWGVTISTRVCVFRLAHIIFTLRPQCRLFVLAGLTARALISFSSGPCFLYWYWIEAILQHTKAC